MKNNNFENLKKFEGHYFTESLSSAGRWLQYKLLLVEPGYIEASILVRDELTNPSKQLHGGMISLISDELCGLSFYSLGYNTFYTTVSLNVNFLYSASLGSTVMVKAKVMRSGKRMANVECHFYDEKNQILAHATSNLMNSGTKIFNLTEGLDNP
jgi:uncharacterized protein (TIGR00369 family)